ncbi:MAG: coiled-coil domain-containing protein, partial [Polaromonas sp.]
AEVQDQVVLAVDSREHRLAAQQRQAQAEAALLEADEALVECRRELQKLNIETLLLTHAPAIDRVETDQAVVRRERDNRVRLEVSAESEAQQLMLQATRLTQTVRPVQSLEELFRQTPSNADRAEFERELEQYQALTQDLQHAKAQLQATRNKLAQHQNEQLAAPASELQQGLSLALVHAQSLGDAEQRLAAMTSTLDTEQRKLDRALANLAFTSDEQLTGSGWLSSSEIDAYDRGHTELLKRLALNADQVKQIEGDLATQQRRRKSLAAAGEVVSAETLKQARMVREEGWQGIRKAFIDKTPGADGANADVPPVGELPVAFERSQAEADRQADLLREGATRAAEVAECEQRIVEMTDNLADLQVSNTTQEQASLALDGGWRQTLADLGLPHGSASRVREWLTLRQSALDQLERLTAAKQARGLLEDQIVEGK